MNNNATTIRVADRRIYLSIYILEYDLRRARFDSFFYKSVYLKLRRPKHVVDAFVPSTYTEV